MRIPYAVRVRLGRIERPSLVLAVNDQPIPKSIRDWSLSESDAFLKVKEPVIPLLAYTPAILGLD